ncbi:triple tyrosine motif-containing protein [Bacillus sp. AL-1R]
MSILTTERITINLLKVDKLSPSIINTNVKWEIDATGNNLEFAWYIYKGGERVEFVPFNVSNVLNWIPKEPGKYFIKAFVKDQDGNKVSEWSSEYKVVDNLDQGDIRKIVPNKQSPQSWGTTINWVAEVEGEELEYAWYIYKDGERVDYIPFTTTNLLEWTPIESGAYRIKLFVKDNYGNKVSKWTREFIIK